MVGSSDRKAFEVFDVRGFSILSGSMVGSSKKQSNLCQHLLMFQYPQRIDGGFKSHLETDRPRGLRVSVSSADRWWVQDRWPLLRAHHGVSFSILSGSMVGSSWPETQDKLADLLFQYPQRIDGGFKLARNDCRPTPAEVSVSSADRWWVQVISDQFSVSSHQSFSILSGSMVGSSQ